MKRLIFGLAVAAVALVLWINFSDSNESATNRFADNISENGSSSRALLPRRSRIAQKAPANISADSAPNDNDGESEFEAKQLSREQIDAYLEKTKRSPDSLINAYIQTLDTNFLAEAAEKYPDNSIVQWALASRLSASTANERQHSLEKLKASSPDNALPNYLSALDAFKAGQPEKAIAEMDAASTKKYNSFDRERMQSSEEMFLLSGLSPVEAREQATTQLLLPNLSDMKLLADEINSLQKKYLANGDTASSQQLSALTVEASRKLAQANNPTLIGELVGFAMENIALKNLDAGTYYEFLGKTPGERLQEIKNRKQEVNELVPVFSQKYQSLTDAEKTIYLERWNLHGEMNAMRWLDNYSPGGK